MIHMQMTVPTYISFMYHSICKGVCAIEFLYVFLSVSIDRSTLSICEYVFTSKCMHIRIYNIYYIYIYLSIFIF